MKVNRCNRKEKQPSWAPFHLLAKPTGSKCNLDCKYCFFLSKEMLYPGDRSRMSDEMLETYIRQLLEAQPLGEVNVAWQGGEPTLMGLDFFQRSIEYVEKYRKPGQRILHTMQTNGTLLDDEWCSVLQAAQLSRWSQRGRPEGNARCLPRQQGWRRELRPGHARVGDAAPARGGGQYPVHDSRRERRSSARSVPVLPR